MKQAGFCLCFRKKATLLQIFFQCSTGDFASDKVSEWLIMIKRLLHLILVLQFYLSVESLEKE